MLFSYLLGIDKQTPFSHFYFGTLIRYFKLTTSFYCKEFVYCYTVASFQC